MGTNLESSVGRSKEDRRAVQQARQTEHQAARVRAMHFLNALAYADVKLVTYQPALSAEQADRSFRTRYSGMAAVAKLNRRPVRLYPQCSVAERTTPTLCRVGDGWEIKHLRAFGV
jgi:hypothetical protein